MSSGIVTYVSIGAGVIAAIGAGVLGILGGLLGWLRARPEVALLERQQAQSRRMVIPPSVSDVERYAGANARLRVLRRRTRLCLAAGGLGVVALVTGVLGALGVWGRAPAAPVVQTAPPAPPPARVVPEVDRARQLLAGLGKLCRAERRRCKDHRRDVVPLVASVCHFHPELCAADQLPAGLTAPSEREQAAAPRVPWPVLQALTVKAASGKLAWDDVQLALP